MNASEIVVGYRTYVDLIKDILKDQKVVSTGMRGEIERVNLALEHSLEGRSVSIISSGDVGIYGMAGLVLEICRKQDIRIGWEKDKDHGKYNIVLEIIPGIPAFCAAASLLGAPLMHDFASVSLSDLLTPWEVIERRVECAAKVDFVLIIYNPKSKKRNWQFSRVKEILLKYRNVDTPAGIVYRAMRGGEKVVRTTLAEMDTFDIDMQTIVIVGNSVSYHYKNFMVTPRGYLDKYKI